MGGVLCISDNSHIIFNPFRLRQRLRSTLFVAVNSSSLVLFLSFELRLLTLKRGPIHCIETVVNIYRSTPRNIPQDSRSHYGMLLYSFERHYVYFDPLCVTSMGRKERSLLTTNYTRFCLCDLNYRNSSISGSS